MRSETHRRALIAAARIAAGAAILGACSGPAEVPPETTVVSEPTEAPANPVPAPTPEEVLACTEMVDKADFKAEPLAAELLACCSTLAEDADNRAVAGTLSQQFPHRNECCSALNWGGSMACTPWGPPNPPTMATA